MRNLAKSIHVALICVILLTGYLHSSSIVSIEDTEEIQLRIYDSYESHEDDSLLGLDEDVLLIGAVMLVVAFPIAGIGVLYVWANSLASDQPESGTRNSYAASDASASTNVVAKILGEDWTIVAVGSETFSTIAVGNETLTTIEKGNEVFRIQ